jgi:hypothetical protein
MFERRAVCSPTTASPTIGTPPLFRRRLGDAVGEVAPLDDREVAVEAAQVGLDGEAVEHEGARGGERAAQVEQHGRHRVDAVGVSRAASSSST